MTLALKLIPYALLETIYMVVVSGALAWVIGLILGITLHVTSRIGMRPMPPLYAPLGVIVNIGRSIPFAILIVAIFPFTRMLVGSSIGTTAAIVPLTIAAAPFMARLVEGALGEVDSRLVEAARVMRASTWQIIIRVLLPEATPSLVNATTLMFVNLVGYSAMAGLVGGGGLGKIAIQYGYQRFNGSLMLFTLIVLLILVEIIQGIGNGIRTSIQHRRGLS